MDARSIVIGYALGYNDGLGDGNGGDDDWSPPDWWLPVPEPEPYDIYVLVWAYKGTYGNTGMNFELFLCRELDNGLGYGNIFCDWGDGTTDELNQIGYPRHTYTEEGQYLVHIIADENTNCWRSSGSNQAAWQIVKTGANIAFVTDYNEQSGYYPYSNLFPNKNYLKYVQINHPKGLPKINYLFQNCYALQKLEIKNKITSLNSRAFESCYGLKKIYLPNCTHIGDYAFSGCYNLQEIVVAEDCVFGTNCFQNCYSLYPRPDGSTN